ncbi:MAG: hypothetical protein J6B87_03510 [Clostridia bacterium]|nr:hypothetical protein [Clostridia bacterium]
MNFKKTLILFAFWWAIVFPNFFFSEEDLSNLQNGNVTYRFWICDVLTDN